MTDEQINAAIAEACGLKKPSRKVKLNDKGFFVTQHAKLPNYCNDLNAMHEAERMFIGPIESQYAENLVEITNADWMEQTRFFCATARQRAEAFLRTLFLWKTDQSGDATEMVKEVQK